MSAGPVGLCTVFVGSIPRSVPVLSDEEFQRRYDGSLSTYLRAKRAEELGECQFVRVKRRNNGAIAPDCSNLVVNESYDVVPTHDMALPPTPTKTRWTGPQLAEGPDYVTSQWEPKLEWSGEVDKLEALMCLSARVLQPVPDKAPLGGFELKGHYQIKRAHGQPVRRCLMHECRGRDSAAGRDSLCVRFALREESRDKEAMLEYMALHGRVYEVNGFLPGFDLYVLPDKNDELGWHLAGYVLDSTDSPLQKRVEEERAKPILLVDLDNNILEAKEQQEIKYTCRTKVTITSERSLDSKVLDGLETDETNITISATAVVDGVQRVKIRGNCGRLNDSSGEYDKVEHCPGWVTVKDEKAEYLQIKDGWEANRSEKESGKAFAIAYGCTSQLVRPRSNLIKLLEAINRRFTLRYLSTGQKDYVAAVQRGLQRWNDHFGSETTKQMSPFAEQSFFSARHTCSCAPERPPESRWRWDGTKWPTAHEDCLFDHYEQKASQVGYGQGVKCLDDVLVCAGFDESIADTTIILDDNLSVWERRLRQQVIVTTKQEGGKSGQSVGEHTTLTTHARELKHIYNSIVSLGLSAKDALAVINQAKVMDFEKSRKQNAKASSVSPGVGGSPGRRSVSPIAAQRSPRGNSHAAGHAQKTTMDIRDHTSWLITNAEVEGRFKLDQAWNRGTVTEVLPGSAKVRFEGWTDDPEIPLEHLRPNDEIFKEHCDSVFAPGSLNKQFEDKMYLTTRGELLADYMKRELPNSNWRSDEKNQLPDSDNKTEFWTQVRSWLEAFLPEAQDLNGQIEAFKYQVLGRNCDPLLSEMHAARVTTNRAVHSPEHMRRSSPSPSQSPLPRRSPQGPRTLADLRARSHSVSPPRPAQRRRTGSPDSSSL